MWGSELKLRKNVEESGRGRNMCRAEYPTRRSRYEPGISQIYKKQSTAYSTEWETGEDLEEVFT